MAVSLGYLTAADSAISPLAFARSAALVASLTSRSPCVAMLPAKRFESSAALEAIAA